jgi:hypothetical protein
VANFFEGIPLRSNADTAQVDASWWNTIRQYLINYFDEYFSGGIVEAQFAIADNQSTYANITDLIIDKDEIVSFDLEYTILRTDGTETRRERGTLYAHVIEGFWSYSREIKNGTAALGDSIEDSLIVSASTGQVQYKSDNMGGTYLGSIRYKVLTAFLKEV